MDPPAVHERLGLRDILPAELRVSHRVRQGRGHVNEEAVVPGTGLDQQDCGGTVFAQAVGQHTAGRTGANNDVVKGLRSHDLGAQR